MSHLIPWMALGASLGAFACAVVLASPAMAGFSALGVIFSYAVIREIEING